MKISDNIETIQKESVIGRTPKGWPINDYALQCLTSTLEDKKNYDQPIYNCKNCGIIVSGLLVPSGCINCGYPQTPDIQ